MLSDSLVEETLDFAEKILIAAAKPSGKTGEAATIALYRGMVFLSHDIMTAAIRLVEVRNSTQDPRDALRDFVLVIRREVGAGSIDEDGINQLWRSIAALSSTKRDGESK